MSTKINIVPDLHIHPHVEFEYKLNVEGCILTYAVENFQLRSVMIENVELCGSVMFYRIGKKPEIHRAYINHSKVPPHLIELAQKLIAMPVMDDEQLSEYIKSHV